MGSKFKRRYRISDSETFPQYLQSLVDRVQQYELPLGASLKASRPDELILEVPRVTLMDLYIYPTSRLSVEFGNNRVSFEARETSLHGSHHIESLQLNDRFDLDLHVDISIQDDILSCQADFQLTVDIPFPFSLTPAPVLQATGNAAVKTVVAQLMDVLARSMVTDHKVWLLESLSESETEAEYDSSLLATS